MIKWLMGTNEDMFGIEKGIMRDEHGDVNILPSFAFSHPEWYTYIGHAKINNELIHVFTFTY